MMLLYRMSGGHPRSSLDPLSASPFYNERPSVDVGCEHLRTYTGSLTMECKACPLYSVPPAAAAVIVQYGTSRTPSPSFGRIRSCRATHPRVLLAVARAVGLTP